MNTTASPRNTRQRKEIDLFFQTKIPPENCCSTPLGWTKGDEGSEASCHAPFAPFLLILTVWSQVCLAFLFISKPTRPWNIFFFLINQQNFPHSVCFLFFYLMPVLKELWTEPDCRKRCSSSTLLIWTLKDDCCVKLVLSCADTQQHPEFPGSSFISSVQTLLISFLRNWDHKCHVEQIQQLFPRRRPAGVDVFSPLSVSSHRFCFASGRYVPAASPGTLMINFKWEVLFMAEVKVSNCTHTVTTCLFWNRAAHWANRDTTRISTADSAGGGTAGLFKKKKKV